MGDSNPEGVSVCRPLPSSVGFPVEWRAAWLVFCIGLASFFAATEGLSAQVEASPVLEGRALLGDTVLTRGTVVLHHVSNATQGEVDSTALAGDGSFQFRLPNVPDPERGDVFLASILHDGVTYFGPWITTANQLDSAYAIQAYDTAMAAAEGADLRMEIRTVFIESVDEASRVTDVFQLVNDGGRTLVAREEGAVWRYPLAAGVTDLTVGESELSPEDIALQDGDLVLRAPMSPGGRMFVVRYRMDDVFTPIPTPGAIEQFDVLIREPAPPLDVEGLSLHSSVELEAGFTYRRYTGASVERPSVRLVAAEVPFQPPVEWVAVIIACLLAGMGLYALRGTGLSWATVKRAPPAPDRHGLLVNVARLDVAFEARAKPSATERTRYEQNRADLLRQIREIP